MSLTGHPYGPAWFDIVQPLTATTAPEHPKAGDSPG
jgi:hypothetical protein